MGKIDVIGLMWDSYKNIADYFDRNKRFHGSIVTNQGTDWNLKFDN